MVRVAALVLPLLAGCSGAADERPAQKPQQIVALFVDALAGCSAGLTPTGEIDQKAIAATGWRLTKRTTRWETEDRTLPLDAYPKLRSGEYEATTWTRAGYADPIRLTRFGMKPSELPDECNISSRAPDAKGQQVVIDHIARHFGRAADRSGELPRGGDFLTPRFDKPMTAHYWAMPQNDVYLITGENGGVRLEINAMPDRASLDKFATVRPEFKIPSIPSGEDAQ